MVATLDEMQEMTETTLAFARGVSADGPPTGRSCGPARRAGRGGSSLGADATFAPNGPVILPLRRVPIRRALRNLIENAQRYGGGARVSLEQTDGTVRIIIDDDGPGIDPAALDRVFDPFERLETSRSRDTGGTGLGLPITRAILRAHGGEIRLENRPRGGLRVIARLPKNGV
ncbi:MAG: ATP-binding protein [Paracoccaceae bacterium]